MTKGAKPGRNTPENTPALGGVLEAVLCHIGHAS